MDEYLKLISAVLNLFDVQQSPQVFLVLAGLAFARLVSFLQIVPFFGGQSVPGRIKICVAISFIVIAWPSLTSGLPSTSEPLPFGPLGFISLLIKEMLMGFTLGFLTSLVFEAIQIAGRLIDAQRGASMAELYAPQLQLSVSELGQFKLQLAIAIFLLIGAHRWFITSLIESFSLVPVLGFPKIGGGIPQLLEFFIGFFGRMMVISLQLAAPGIIGLLLADLFFGLINRVAPQINVFFLSMPVKSYLGLALVLFALWQYQDVYLNSFKETFQAFEYMLQALNRAHQQ